jgi:hypothetical protein
MIPLLFISELPRSLYDPSSHLLIERYSATFVKYYSQHTTSFTVGVHVLIYCQACDKFGSLHPPHLPASRPSEQAFPTLLIGPERRMP